MKSAIVMGGATFAASKFLWDASTGKAVMWGLIVGGIAYFLANQRPASPTSAL